MEEVFRLKDEIRGVDFSSAIRLMDESLKLKRKILQMSMEYRRMLQQVDMALVQALPDRKTIH